MYLSLLISTYAGFLDMAAFYGLVCSEQFFIFLFFYSCSPYLSPGWFVRNYVVPVFFYEGFGVNLCYQRFVVVFTI